VTISQDRSVKVFDVVGFDMILMMKLPYTPGVAEWVFKVRAMVTWCDGVMVCRARHARAQLQPARARSTRTRHTHAHDR
jgi:hypothetical protein